MKKIQKTNSKKGFTLVEVMLAVAIMAVASLMIMRGFLATMNYANNSSIYSRAGSVSYAAAITHMSTSAADSNILTRNAAIMNSATSTQVMSMTVSDVTIPNNSMEIGVWKEVGDLSSYSSYNVGGYLNESTSYSTNRTSFFYIIDTSLMCGDCGAVGSARRMRKGGTTQAHWVCNAVVTGDDGSTHICYGDICG